MKRILTPLLLLISTIALAQTTPIPSGSLARAGQFYQKNDSIYVSLGAGGTIRLPVYQDVQYKTVQTVVQRNAIPSIFRKPGMAVFVADSSKQYVLYPGITNSDWNELQAGISLTQLTDSLSNYQRVADGLISGGSATIYPTGGDSLIINSGVVRISSVNYNFSYTIFADLPPSSSGKTRILSVYAVVSGGVAILDTLSSPESVSPVPLVFGADTSVVAMLPIYDSGPGIPSSALSGKANLVGGNTFTGGDQDIYGEVKVYPNFGAQGVSISGLNPRLKLIGDANSYYPGIEFQSIGNPAYASSIQGYDGLSFNSYNHFRFNSNSTQLVRFNSDGTVIISPTLTSLPVTKRFMVDGDININGDYYKDGVPIGSGGGSLLASNNLSDVSSVSSSRTNLGLGTGDSPTFTGLNLSGETASTIASFDASKNVKSLSTSTYPSLTELSYVKGVTSSIQTQLNAKQSTISFGAIGSTPNANGASISSGVITLQPASSSFGGLVTTGTQTFAGNKTFAGVTTHTDSTAFAGVKLGSLAGGGTQSLIINNAGQVSAVPVASYITGNRISKTANYTITTSDYGANGTLVVGVDATAGAVTITLPSLANMSGINVRVFKTDSSGNSVTISGAVNVNGSASYTLSTQWNSVDITGGSTVYLAK